MTNDNDRNDERAPTDPAPPPDDLQAFLQACKTTDADVHAFNVETAKRLIGLVAAAADAREAIGAVAGALDLAELRGQRDGTDGVCPGDRRCYARNGTQPCRIHGCRVCGCAILADCESWPAPLCIAHAPEPLFDWLDQIRSLSRRLVEAFDGMHRPDCRSLAGGAVSDLQLELELVGGNGCTCGAFALREEARSRLALRRSGGKRGQA